jgi:hypothetical protein
MFYAPALIYGFDAFRCKLLPSRVICRNKIAVTILLPILSDKIQILSEYFFRNLELTCLIINEDWIITGEANKHFMVIFLSLFTSLINHIVFNFFNINNGIETNLIIPQNYTQSFVRLTINHHLFDSQLPLLSDPLKCLMSSFISTKDCLLNMTRMSLSFIISLKRS